MREDLRGNVGLGRRSRSMCAAVLFRLASKSAMGDRKPNLMARECVGTA